MCRGVSCLFGGLKGCNRPVDMGLACEIIVCVKWISFGCGGGLLMGETGYSLDPRGDIVELLVQQQF